MEFRGRVVYDINGYPAVTWRQHPMATIGGGGYAYIHRIVAYEQWGDEVFGKHVHHKDEDKYNFDPDNLKLLTPAEHVWEHTSPPVEKVCPICGVAFMVYDAVRKRSTGTCCSNKCRARANERITWPETKRLLEMVDDIGYEAAGRVLGVSGNAVRKRIRRHPEAKHFK